MTTEKKEESSNYQGRPSLQQRLEQKLARRLIHTTPPPQLAAGDHGALDELSAPPIPALPLGALALLFLGGLAFGGAVAWLATLPALTLAVTGIALGGLLVALLCGLLRRPLAPLLQILLAASYSFTLDVTLFPVFKYNRVGGLNVSLMLLLALLLLGLHLLARLGGKPREQVFPLSFSLLALALLLWCAVGVLNSSEQRLGFYALWELAACLLICFVVANEFGDRAALRLAALALIVGVGVNSVVGALQATFDVFSDWTLLGAAREEDRQYIGESEYARATGLLTAANAFAWYLVMLLPLLLALLALRVPDFRRWRRGLLAGAAAAGVVALALTYSRGGWLTFALELPLFLVLALGVMPRVYRRRFVWQAAGAAVVAVLLCLPFAKPLYLRLTEDDNYAAAVRWPLMRVAQTMIMENPLLGVGLANYEAEMRRYDHTPERVADAFDWPVHNLFLHSAAEAGLPALLFFLALLAVALRRGWAARHSTDPLLRALGLGLVVGLFAYLVTGLKEPGSLGEAHMRDCMFICGLLLALDRARRRAEEVTGVGSGRAQAGLAQTQE